MDTTSRPTKNTDVCPTAGPGHPPQHSLEPYRTTIATDTMTDEVHQTIAEHTWTGITNLNTKEDYAGDEQSRLPYQDQMLRCFQEAPPARGKRSPTTPSDYEVAEHCLTHLPYRTWRKICVRSKEKQDAYRKNLSRQPVTQVDLAYFTTTTNSDDGG